MPTITTKSTPEEIQNILYHVVQMLVGNEPDITGGLCQALNLRAGTVLLQLIKLDFERKARGEVGEDGTKWKELSPTTIAQRRLGGEDRKAIALKRRATGLAPAEQRQMAKEIKRRQVDMVVKFGLSPGQAKGLARAQVENKWRKIRQVYGRSHENVPWITSKIYTDLFRWLGAQKKRGANAGQSGGGVGHISPMFAYLSTRHVLILRDTDSLFRSFSPGVDGDILEAPKGKIIVGTNRHWWHHRGGKNLPSRPFWPLNGALPDSWYAAMGAAINRGLIEIITFLVRQRAEA